MTQSSKCAGIRPIPRAGDVTNAASEHESSVPVSTHDYAVGSLLRDLLHVRSGTPWIRKLGEPWEAWHRRSVRARGGHIP